MKTSSNLSHGMTMNGVTGMYCDSAYPFDNLLLNFDIDFFFFVQQPCG